METSLKILILEDSPDDVHLIERELTKAGIQFTSLVARTQPEFEDGLKRLAPDVVLSDHSLPQFNSVEALRIVSDYNRQNGFLVPFILVTGTVAEDFAVQSIKSGAADFILKDRLKRLPSAITNALEKSASELDKARYLEDLIARERLLRQAEGLAHFGSWYGDLRTKTYQWSDETFRIFGYEPGEIRPDFALLLRHIHPEDLRDFTANRDRMIRTLDTFENDFRIIDRHGKLKHLALKVEVRRDETNTPVALIGVNLDITRHKEAEHLLRRSREEYKSLFDQNPDLVYSLDLQGNFTNINRSLIELTGRTEHELLKFNFRPFIKESDSQKVEQHFQSAVQGKGQRYVTGIVTAKGQEYVLDVTNMPIIVDGKVVGVHGVGKDITDKVRLERLLDRVYELARIGGWEVNFLTGVVKWTAITRELHEAERDFVPDLETGINFYPEGKDREAIKNAINEALEYGKPFDLELQIVTAKGNLRWIRTIGEAEFKNGRCLRLYGSFQDIHERKSAEEKLKEAYLEKSVVLESIGEALFTVDKNWIVTYWNPVAERTLRMPSAFIKGKSLWEVYPDAVSLSFYPKLLKAMKEKLVMQFEDYYPPANLWAEASVYPSSAGLSVYFRDVTTLKRHRLAIEQQNKKLREIAWSLSHDMRAPLASLMGLVQIIKDHPTETTDLPKTLRMILSSAGDLDDVIRRIVLETEALGLD